MASDVQKQFGNRLRELRLAKELSQEGLAARTGLDRSYVGGIERGERGERNPSLLNIAKLAKALDCDLADLFPRDADRG